MTQQMLAARVQELEREMKAVQAQLRAKQGRKSATAYIGIFNNDPDFKDAVARGAAYRRAQRPKIRKKSAR